MEEVEAADCGRKSGGARKRTRKRPYTRKASLNATFINMAQARREIFNALQLHRSSSTVTNPAVPYYSSHHQQLTESSMPPPEPAVELLEVEWFDNVSASYSWWMGFLGSLDRKNNGGDESAAERPCLGRKSGLDATDPNQNPFTDEWVVFPPAEESGPHN